MHPVIICQCYYISTNYSAEPTFLNVLHWDCCYVLNFNLQFPWQYTCGWKKVCTLLYTYVHRVTLFICVFCIGSSTSSVVLWMLLLCRHYIKYLYFLLWFFLVFFICFETSGRLSGEFTHFWSYCFSLWFNFQFSWTLL